MSLNKIFVNHWIIRKIQRQSKQPVDCRYKNEATKTNIPTESYLFNKKVSSTKQAVHFQVKNVPGNYNEECKQAVNNVNNIRVKNLPVLEMQSRLLDNIFDWWCVSPDWVK